MGVVWTTERGPDPRLSRQAEGVRAGAVATAVVAGSPVFVTATSSHDHGDCGYRDRHDCAAAMTQVWDAATGRLARTVDGMGGESISAAREGNSSFAVVAAWSTATAIDLDSGAVLRELSDVTTAVVASGPAIVAVGWDGRIRLVDIATGAEQVCQAGERLHDVCVVEHGARTVVAVAGDGGLGIWDLNAGARVAFLPTPLRMHAVVAWPADGGDVVIAARSEADEFSVWEVGARREHRCAVPIVGAVSDVAAIVAADGRRLLAVADRESVQLWDVAARRPSEPPLVGATTACGVAGAQPGVLVTVSDFGDALGIWRLDSGLRPAAAGHSCTITSLAATPDGRIVAGGLDGVLGAFRLADGTREPAVGTVRGPVHAIAATEVGGRTAILAGGGDTHRGGDPELHRWFADGADRPISLDQAGEIRQLAVCRLRGRPTVLAGGSDKQVLVIDIADGHSHAAMPGSYGPDGIAVGTVDGMLVAALTRHFEPFQLWDLVANVLLPTPRDTVRFGERVHALVTLDEQPAIVTSIGNDVRVRALVAVESRVLGDSAAGLVAALAVRPAPGPVVAVARMDHTVTVHDLASGTDRLAARLPEPAQALAWAPSGDLIIACGRDLLCWRE